jgi:hypothetical protein
VLFGAKTVPYTVQRLPRRRLLSYGVLTAGTLLFPLGDALAQTVDARHWHGFTAATRQPEQVVASTIGEWRSLWSRVGAMAPDLFEPGRMSAVGIFLGRRASDGYSVNIMSVSRRRDRIVVVFEERMPVEIMMAQRASPAPAPRPVGGGAPPAAGGFGGPGASFAPPGSTANLAPPPPSRPASQPTSPWAIILISRSDLPVSVEQRLFR